MTIDRKAAAALAERGLAAVVGDQIVAALREDSPLAGFGLSSGDIVCVGDAVAEAAMMNGSTCELTDDDVAGLLTVADLVSAIAERGTSAR